MLESERCMHDFRLTFLVVSGHTDPPVYSDTSHPRLSRNDVLRRGQVAYFKFSRGLVVSDSDKQQLERLGHLREAGEFAEWSRRDRESKLPPLTDEQHEQMQLYLRLVERHGLRRVVDHRWRANGDGYNDGAEDDDDDCVGSGCPAFRHVTRKSTNVSPGASR
jgi:hypothetical protein